jgi:hypothetical protein
LGRALAALLCVSLAGAKVRAQVDGMPYAACGTITVGPQGCFVFHPDAGGNYFLQNNGGFGAGQHVYVSGTFQEQSLACPPFYAPGIVNNVVYTCFDGCGTLVQGVPCLLFQPDGSTTPYVLDNLGGFTAGAHVHVVGGLQPGCISICLQGAGCIHNLGIESCEPPASIIAANPPRAADNPYQPGQPFTDALSTGNSGVMVTQGIGGSGTPDQGPIQYSPILVTFSATPSPAPDVSNVTISCTRTPCPTITGVTATAGNSFAITLSHPIPPLGCTTLTFPDGERVQYRSHPVDMNLDGFSSTQDLLTLVQAINDGSANLPENLARYNMTRSGGVNTQDLLEMVQHLNGTNAPQPYNGTQVDICP